MDRNSLKEYFSMLIDMEKNILLQNNTIKQLQAQVDELSKINSYCKPIPPNPEKESWGSVLRIIPVTGIGALLVYWGLSLLNSNSTTLGEVIGSFIGGWIVLILDAVFLIPSVFGFMGLVLSKITANNKYEESQKAYMNEVDTYETNMEWERQRAEENAPRIDAYKQELLLLQEVNEKSKTSLASMYDANIVYPKYRNLPMICSIYEYLASDRVDTLEVLNGAYNLLELEMRLDRIVTKLDVVVEQLHRICDNQNMLYTVIIEANSDTRNLASALNEQKQASAIVAYSTERTAKELSYMNRMNYLAGRNDGTFFNLLPL